LLASVVLLDQSPPAGKLAWDGLLAASVESHQGLGE
jgi:hypothetical protein